MRRPVFPNSGPSRAAVIASCRHQLLTSSPAARAALSTWLCSSSVSLKLTDLVRFASLILVSFRVHSVHTPACGSVASYTRKALQRLDQADVYTPRRHHRHASGGVVSLYSGAKHLRWSSFNSRLFLIPSENGYVLAMNASLVQYSPHTRRTRSF